MAAIKPFSYLTGETRPLPKSGFRRPTDEAYGKAQQENASPRPTRSPKTSEDGGSSTMAPEPPNKDLSHRAVNNVRLDVDAQPQGGRVQQTAPDSEYRKEEQQNRSDLKQNKKNRLEIIIAPAAPDRGVAAPPSRIDEQTDKYVVVVDNVPCTSRDHLYGKRQIDGQMGITKKTETNPDTSTNRQFLHDPQVNRRQEEIIATAQNSTSSTASCEIPAPYSYTEPMRPAPLLRGAAQPSSDGQYGKKPGSGEGRVDDNLRYLPPTSSPTADNLLGNFILVGGPSTKTESSGGGQVVAGEPTKRLKLQELFDPPPPPPLMPPPLPPTPPRRFSIHGVTNTESSDYHHHHHHHHAVLDNKISSNPNGNGNYIGIKGPAAYALESPDYPMTGSGGVETGSSLHDSRSASHRSTGKASVAMNYWQRCRCDRRLCLAIVITALVTSVICLGSGFIAGWFGKDTCKGNGQC